MFFNDLPSVWRIVLVSVEGREEEEGRTYIDFEHGEKHLVRVDVMKSLLEIHQSDFCETRRRGRTLCFFLPRVETMRITAGGGGVFTIALEMT